MEQAPPLGTRPRILLSGGNAPFKLAPFEIIILLVLLGIAAFAGYEVYAKASGLNKTAPAAPTYIPAFRSTLTSSVSTTGTVQASQQVNLTFDIGTGTAKITQFLVGLGDQVKQGQPLAKLDDTELQQAVRSAQASLDSTNARYGAAVSPSADAIAAAQQSIASATAQVTTAQNNLTTLLSAPTSADLLSAKQAAESAQGSLTTAQNNLQSAKDSLTSAQNDFNAAKVAMNAAYQQITAASAASAWPVSCPRPFVVLSQQAQTVNCPATATGSVTSASNTPTAGSSNSSTSASTAVSNYNGLVSSYNSSVTALTSKQTALNTAQSNLSNGALDQAIQTAQAGLATAKQKLSDTQAGAKQSDIDAARNSLTSAQAGLASAQTKFTALVSPTADVTLPLLANVESARDNLATAQQNLNNATITAPFDGQISQVTGNIGTQVSSSTIVFILLNPSLVRIDANVDQADINNLKLGQTAAVTFDALAGRSYNTTVAAIGLTPTIQSGVVTYVVSFAMDTSVLPAGTPIPAPGMTASLTVQTARTDNALVVPSRAVRRGTQGRATVTVKSTNGGPDQVKNVTTGATNGTLTQISTGLTDGDLVLVSSGASATSTVTTTQFGPGGGLPGIGR